MKAILFVDDHEVLARLSCEILEMQGYRAVSAYNASDALEKFDCGAALIQLYTGFVYEGPTLVHEICQALLTRQAAY